MTRLLIMGILGAVAAGTLFSTVGRFRKRITAGKGDLRDSGSSAGVGGEPADDGQDGDEDGGVHMPCCPSLGHIRSLSSREASSGSSSAVAALESLPAKDDAVHTPQTRRHRRTRSRSSLDDSMLRREMLEKPGGLVMKSGPISTKDVVGESGKLLVHPKENVKVKRSESFPSKISVPRGGDVKKDSQNQRCEDVNAAKGSVPASTYKERRGPSRKEVRSAANQGNVLPVARVIAVPVALPGEAAWESPKGTRRSFFRKDLEGASRGHVKAGGGTLRGVRERRESDGVSESEKVDRTRHEAVVRKRQDNEVEESAAWRLARPDIGGFEDISEVVDEGWEVMEELLAQGSSNQQEDGEGNVEFFDAKEVWDNGTDSSHEDASEKVDAVDASKSAKVLEEAWELLHHLMELEEAIYGKGSKEADGVALSSEQFEAMFGKNSDYERSLDHKHRKWFTDYSELCELSTRLHSDIVKLGDSDFRSHLQLDQCDFQSGNEFDGNRSRRSDAYLPDHHFMETGLSHFKSFRNAIQSDNEGEVSDTHPASPVWSDGEPPVDADLAEGLDFEALRIDMSESDAQALAEMLASVPLVTSAPELDFELPVAKSRVRREGVTMDLDGRYGQETYRTCWFRGDDGESCDDGWASASPSSLGCSVADGMNLEQMIEMMEEVIAERDHDGGNENADARRRWEAPIAEAGSWHAQQLSPRQPAISVA